MGDSKRIVNDRTQPRTPKEIGKRGYQPTGNKPVSKPPKGGTSVPVKKQTNFFN